MFSSKPTRRTFVAHLAALAGASVMLPEISFASASGEPGDEPEAWLKALNGKHRQLFHAHDKWTKGIEYSKRYKESYPIEYGVKPSDVDAVLAAHGKTGVTTYVDAAWEKYGFGKMFDVKDPKTNDFASRNIYYAGDDEDPGIREALSAGVIVLSCRTALRGIAKGLAAQNKFGTAEEIERDLTASLIPGVILVAAMIIAIGRAQEQRCTYAYTG
jgi:hypothetical protein